MKHPPLKNVLQSNRLSDRFQNLFESNFLDQLGFFTGFTKRIKELSGQSFINSCLDMAMKEGWAGSLAEHCSVLRANYGISIKEQSLNERFNAKSEWMLRILFEQVMALHLRQENPMKLLEHFEEVYIQDSTNFELPAVLKTLYKGCGGGASEAGLKIDAIYGLRWGSLAVQFHGSAGTDHWQGVPQMKKGSLLLRDLGYFKVSDFKLIEQSESFYLSRLMFNVNVYQDPQGDKELDLLEYLKDMTENEIRNLKVYLGKENLFEVRLIIQKVPQAIAEYKQHKLKTDKQNKRKQLSPRRLELCHINCYITNIPEQVMASQHIIRLYGLRWIIEILFKAWKSIAGLKEKINCMNPHRFMCMLYAHMIKALLSTKLVHFFKIEFWNLFGFKISELKAFKVLKAFEPQWWNALRSAKTLGIQNILEQIADTILNLAQKRKYSDKESYCDFYTSVNFVT